MIRLLTIHGAKGLEFKVVVVADAGREGSAATPTRSSPFRTGASASASPNRDGRSGPSRWTTRR